MLRVIIEADTAAELEEAIHRLASGGNTSQPPAQPAPTAAPDAFRQFMRSRSENQLKIINELQNEGGRMTLRNLEKATGLKGLSFSGTLGSLIRSGHTILGRMVVETGPWFVNGAGDVDREYTLNLGDSTHNAVA